MKTKIELLKEKKLLIQRHGKAAAVLNEVTGELRVLELSLEILDVKTFNESGKELRGILEKADTCVSDKKVSYKWGVV